MILEVSAVKGSAVNHKWVAILADSPLTTGAFFGTAKFMITAGTSQLTIKRVGTERKRPRNQLDFERTIILDGVSVHSMRLFKAPIIKPLKRISKLSVVMLVSSGVGISPYHHDTHSVFFRCFDNQANDVIGAWFH